MHQENRPKWSERKVGALWVRKTATGEDKFVIRININGETINLIGLNNTAKQEKQHPDSIVYRAVEDLKE
jgi:hypothetical protein